MVLPARFVPTRNGVYVHRIRVGPEVTQRLIANQRSPSAIKRGVCCALLSGVYQRLCSLNHGELPLGVHVSYYEAMFSNGAREKAPDSWDDVKLNKWAEANKLAPLPLTETMHKRYWCETVGQENRGSAASSSRALPPR